MLPRLIESVSDFNSESKAQDIEKFFQKNSAPQAARTIKQVIEKIYSNADFLKRDKLAIEDFLKKNVK